MVCGGGCGCGLCDVVVRQVVSVHHVGMVLGDSVKRVLDGVGLSDSVRGDRGSGCSAGECAAA
jgi:hypothetical protein